MRAAKIGMLLFGLLAVVTSSILAYRLITKDKTETPKCVAGPGEICPSDDFITELDELKRLDDQQRTLSQSKVVKELIAINDTRRGMADRMQQEINSTLQANPGHMWDGNKRKFVPAPPPVITAPAPTPAPKK